MYMNLTMKMKINAVAQNEIARRLERYIKQYFVCLILERTFV